MRFLGWEDPWRRKWQPTPVSLPGEPQGQRRGQVTVQGIAQVGHDSATKPAPATPEGLTSPYLVPGSPVCPGPGPPHFSSFSLDRRDPLIYVRCPRPALASTQGLWVPAVQLTCAPGSLCSLVGHGLWVSPVLQDTLLGFTRPVSARRSPGSSRPDHQTLPESSDAVTWWLPWSLPVAETLL